jgi:hypothetical protein
LTHEATEKYCCGSQNRQAIATLKGQTPSEGEGRASIEFRGISCACLIQMSAKYLMLKDLGTTSQEPA